MKKILNFTFFSLSSFALLYFIYKSEFVFSGNKRWYYFFDFILFGTILLLSTVCFFSSKKIKNYITICLTTIILSIYLFELFLVFSSNNSQTRYEYFKQKLKVNENIKLAYGSNEFYNKDEINLLPLSGISNSKTIMCNESGYFSKYESDRYGFNNPDEEWNKNNYKYLLLGDSFVHGACVNRPHDIASNLRLLSGEAVLNLGYGGQGTLSKYATLKEYFPGNVDTILWFFFERNDIADLKNEIKNKILYNYFEDENFKQNLINQQNYIDEIKNNHLANIKPKKKRSQFKNAILLFNFRYLIKNIFFWKQEKIIDEFELIIKKVKKFSNRNNSRLIFIYLPEYLRFVSPNFNNDKYNKIKNIVEINNIDFLDIVKLFEETNDPLNFFPLRKSGHYNELGYREIAEFILLNKL